MVTHHPNTGILADFSAGMLGMSPACCVAVHLEFCHDCRARVAQFETLEGELFDALPAEPLAGDTLPSVLRQLGPTPPATRPGNEGRSGGSMPRPLAKMLPAGLSTVDWKKYTNSLKSAVLATGDHTNQLSLLRMRAGRSPGRHDHGGTEWTVVLQGGFSDHKGVYGPGDFVALGAGDVHQPVAHQNEDCICLAAQNAPIRLTGWLGHLVNPRLSISPL
jgi:putative transcriptional regulator